MTTTLSRSIIPGLDDIVGLKDNKDNERQRADANSPLLGRGVMGETCSGGLAPEAGGEVHEDVAGLGVSAVLDEVEALVGLGRFQGAQMGQVGAEFDIVEVVEVYLLGEDRTAAVPGCFDARVALLEARGDGVDLRRGGVAAHQGNTADAGGLAREQAVDSLVGQGFARVAPEVLGVASRAAAGASREVDGQRHLVGNLLKDNICIDVLKHLFFTVHCRRGTGVSLVFSFPSPLERGQG